jgi:hypothetical protein
MARVIAMLREARAAGLDVRRDGDALIVRGPEDQGGLARNLLVIKPLVLAALQREDEYRGHELTCHEGDPADWWQGAGGRLLCATCQPPLIPDVDDDPTGAVRAVMAAADQAIAAAERAPAPRTCSTCGSTGRCEGRLPTTDGGWVCRAAQAMGLFSGNGKHLWVRLRSGPGTEA